VPPPATADTARADSRAQQLTLGLLGLALLQIAVDRHIAHRVAAGIMLAALVWLARQTRQRPVAERRLVVATLALHVVNVGLGGLHVVTEVSSTVAIVLHLTIGATAWVTLVAAWSHTRSPAASPRPTSAHVRQAAV
jgi:heme A synthase